MEKGTSQRPEENKGNIQLRLIMSVLTAAIFFIVDLYVMICMPANIPVFVIVTVLFLVAIYLCLDTVIRISQQKSRQSEEVYDNILKSEKASYLLVKKSFEELSMMLEMLDVKSEGSTEEIINAQKALSKVIINREKENADAIMNSNDHVVEKVAFMENAMADLKPSILQEQKEQIKAANDEVVLKQERLFIELNNMEASMRDGMTEVSMKLSGFQEEIEKMADTLATMVASVAEKAVAAQSAPAPTPVAQSVPVPTPVVQSAPAPVVETVSQPVPEVVPEPVTIPVVESSPVVQEMNVDSVSPATVTDSPISSELMENEDEIKLEDILSIDDIVNSITEETATMDMSIANKGDTIDVSSIMDSLDNNSILDTIGSINEDINLEDMESLNTDISLDSMESLDTDISLDGMESLDADISLDGMESLDVDISLDGMESLDTDISLDGMESLDADISLDGIESLDADISLDGMESLNTDISLDSMESLDADISLDGMESLDADISLDGMESLNTDINLDDFEGLDNITENGEDAGNLGIDFNITEDNSLDDILKMAEEPVVEEKPSVMDSNPNKIMTPEEIAALVAGASEPAEKKEEVVKEIPKEEPKASMPDLSNPNKIMTPEEIAALLANM